MSRAVELFIYGTGLLTDAAMCMKLINEFWLSIVTSYIIF